MKRPILIFAIGYLLGIIWELYFEKSLVPFFIAILVIIFLLFFKLYKPKRSIKRIIIVFFNYYNLKVILVSITAFFIAVVQINGINSKIKKAYEKFENNEMIYVGTIISDKKEGKYKDSYIIKVEYVINNNTLEKNHYKYILKLKKKNLEYGDKVQIKGILERPNKRRNYKGFSYEEYLKSQEIIGIINSEDEVYVINKKNMSFMHEISYNCKTYIIKTISKLLPNDTKDLALGFLLGYTDKMSDDLKDEFRTANLSHMLAVSGAHISYIILGLTVRIK